VNKLILISLILLPLASSALAAEGEPTHYCDDVQAWKDWENLVAKYPEDDTLATAYALRIGLCQQVKDGTIEAEKAIDLFDRFFKAMKDATAEQERREKAREGKGST
jgi:hypothetical protein